MRHFCWVLVSQLRIQPTGDEERDLSIGTQKNPVRLNFMARTDSDLPLDILPRINAYIQISLFHLWALKTDYTSPGQLFFPSLLFLSPFIKPLVPFWNSMSWDSNLWKVEGRLHSSPERMGEDLVWSMTVFCLFVCLHLGF